MNEVLSKMNRITANYTSFLSPSVHNLVVYQIKNSTLNPTSHSTSVWDEDTFINWNSLTPILLADAEHKLHPTLRSPDWYLRHSHSVRPFLIFLHISMMKCNENKLCMLMESTQWMKQPETLEICFRLWRNNREAPSDVNSFECILLITAAMERALGNLFCVCNGNKPVPSMLRDLLGTDELRNLLGDTQIVMMQLLIGSPLSYNLRNLIWHGFASPAELDAAYASSLLLICASIGRRLLADQHDDACHLNLFLADNVTVPRPWKSFPQSDILAGILPLHSAEAESPSWWVSHSSTIPLFMKDILTAAIDHHVQGNYGRCCALIVPQMELLLRLMFCVANRCEDRLLTAESTALYTTLDVILAEHLPSAEISSAGSPICKENKMKDILGGAVFWAVRDVFSLPEGPRIRDRLSHGECRLSDIDKTLSNHLVSLSIILLHLLVTGDLSDGLQDETSRLLQRITDVCPLFHPVAILKRELASAFSAVDAWIEQLACSAVIGAEVGNPDPCATSASTLASFSDSTRLLRLIETFGFPAHVVSILHKWMHKPLDPCYIRRRGQEIVLHFDRRPVGDHFSTGANLATLRQIARETKTAVQSIVTSLANYQSQLKAHQLRSRQRSTLARLLDYCPLYLTAIQLVLLYPLGCAVASDREHQRQQSIDQQIDDPKSSAAFLRSAARFADNASSLSHNHKNRWMELAQCARRFLVQHAA